FEGGIVYLSHRVTGVCKPFFARAASDEQELEKTMTGPKADWVRAAAKLVEAGKPAPIKDFLTRYAHKLTLRDSLFGYAFMAFLVEGGPDRASKYLRVIGRLNPDEAAEEAFGVDVAALESRFHRWLREYR